MQNTGSSKNNIVQNSRIDRGFGKTTPMRFHDILQFDLCNPTEYQTTAAAAREKLDSTPSSAYRERSLGRHSGTQNQTSVIEFRFFEQSAECPEDLRTERVIQSGTEQKRGAIRWCFRQAHGERWTVRRIERTDVRPVPSRCRNSRNVRFPPCRSHRTRQRVSFDKMMP